MTVILMVAASVVALAFCFQSELMSHWQDIRGSHSDWIWARLASASVADSGVFIGAIGALGRGVLAWTYQSGSTRLGVVDLFACEIATPCRVAAVTDMVPGFIRLFDAGHAVAVPHGVGDTPAGNRFTSQESYFPVFDASVRDLQQLEADVVTNVTAFYTLSAVNDEWHRALCNVIYMQFLGFESVRKAIRELVEFEPAQAEDICTILLSELVAYRFLREQFSGDLRERRLASREPEYRRVIPDLCRTVKAGAGPSWEKAQDLAEGVMKLYATIFPNGTRTPKRSTPARRPAKPAAARAEMAELVPLSS